MSSLSFANASRLAFLLPAALLAFAPALPAQTPEEEADLGESPERYAQVRLLEGSATINKGEIDEPLTQGTPVAEGDVVESRGRGVLQLGDGTRIAFGPNTRFRVAALFAERQNTREVLLRLDYGRLRVRVGRQSDASVRVDTPSGTGTVADSADATFELGRDNTLRFRVHGGRTNFKNARGHLLVRAGERLTVYSNEDTLDRLNDFNTSDEDAFDQWAGPLLIPRRSESATRVPSEIRYYADDLDEHGKWTYVDECSSWCWSPAGVAEDWRPYYEGRWGAYPGGMTWISSEPWGYVTYHHGRWGWGAGLGWYWIPGVNYSPAWVAWQSDSAYFGWAPLGYYNRPSHWGYGAWGGGGCWNVVNINFINSHSLRSRFRTDFQVINRFNRGTASTTWVPGSPRPAGNPGGPWFRGRMMVTPNEFRDPAQIQHLAGQRELVQTRVHTYDQSARAATGRAIQRRDARLDPNPGQRSEPAAPRGFEADRPRPADRPLLRDSRTLPPAGAQSRPEPGRPGTEGHTPNPGQERRPEPGRERPTMEDRRPTLEDRRPEPTRERPRTEDRRPDPVMERPRTEERRPDPVRERPRMEERRPEPTREAPRQEFRPTPTQAPRQEFRPTPTQAPRQESRPAPVQAPRQESRPAPSPSPRQEARKEPNRKD